MFNFYSYKNDIFKTSVNPWKVQTSSAVQNVNIIDSASVEQIVSEMKKHSKEIHMKKTSIPNVFSLKC